ncbi:tetratricopeptide repeat protein [Nonomuraea sp. NPDC050404]|uniref:tetratricopeptide repeat protein n=1 Tax=Nonomuraea sp. NPDC050404 TaxID=3155783 RepID=UPI0033ED9459
MSHPHERLDLAQELAEAEEAVGEYRRLAVSDPGLYLPGLGVALDRCALLLGLAGRRAEAVAVAEEAVDLFRELSGSGGGSGPGVHAMSLASALVNLGNQLAELRHHDRALVSLRAAVELCRRHGSELRLASSLEHLGIKLGEMGQADEALGAHLEAMQLRRPLIEAGSTDDAIDHWGGLLALIHQLHQMGREEEAAPYQDLAARYHRHVRETRPGFIVFIDDLLARHGYRVTATGFRRESAERVSELNEEGLRLMRAGRLDDAAARFQQVIGLPADDARLATPLHNLAVVLSRLGRYGEAVEPLERAVRLHRAAAMTDDRRRPQLASSLNNLGWTLLAVERFKDALAPLEEAIGLQRENAGSPAGLARSLYNRGVALGHLGRHGEALDSTEEAVALLRPLYVREPDTHREGFRDALTWLGRQLGQLGRAREARAAVREAERL